MANFSFKLPNGKSFDLKGPPDLTFDQAKAIFDTQADTGALTGLKPGGILSAASQAAKGLTSAISSLGQQASGVIGALGGKISTAAGQIGSLATQALGSAKSIAEKTISAVKGAISIPSTDGIDIANFAKQSSALVPIGGLDTAEATGVLAQTKKLVGQAADKITNSKGVGSYGFDIKQLETAGFVKPGTSALVSAGSNTISSILKSPSVFTGKDGVKDASGLLSNVGLQDKTQQELMAAGSAGLKSLGIPTDLLGPQGAAGLLMSAAKSLPNTEAFVKGLPLPASVTASINKNISEGAFAVKLTDIKIPEVFKAETVPVPAVDTTNRETLNAAANRILGNPKIPAPNYGPSNVNGFV
jgi:hypothetical protein